MLSWDSTALRAPTLPWTPLHHSAIKQEPMEPPMVNGFISSRSEGFHSASPSSSSRDSNPQSSRSNTPHSPHDQSATGFGPLTPPGIEAAPENMRTPAGQPLANTVTPPKSPSPSPPWVSHSEGAPSPGDSAPECDEEPGLRVPAVNSHGKVKTFKCKQCQFVAVTKVDFWEHSRVHIKPERMLTCLQCPFVTEYKHHLEYHMRNHVGVKPFECKLCAYTCVNKSMLNSHLKSHSNVYQYRCADCNYATKYCHSLKLHLRKYEHQPAMVLNQDGTPNPLPIIDVYGTRRGPKQRTQSKMQEETVQTAMSVAQPHSLFSNPFGVSFPYAPLLQHPMLFPHNNNLNEPNIFAKVMENSKKEEEIQMQTLQNIPPHLLLQQRFLTEYSREASDPAPLKSPPREKPSPRASPYSPRRTRAPSRSSTVEANVQQSADALDLTSGRPELQIDPPTTPTTSLKHRRKGKAFKLERSRMEEDEPEMASLASAQVEEIEVSVDLPKYDYESDNKTDNEKSISSPEPMDHQSQADVAAKDDYDCHYCDIVFKDIVMYTMHMGYHGFKDPFTCNMCGHSSADKVSFFVHIARSQHS